MRWRYQPVYEDDDAGRSITLCECHFDASGRLQSWTENFTLYPSGETVEELASDLSRMLADTYKWEPVPLATLKVGMVFQRTGANVEGMLAAMYMARNSMS